MILVEIRDGEDGSTIPVSSGLTLVQGIDGEKRERWLSGLVKALCGDPSPIEVEVEVAGRRQPLNPELATTTGIGDVAGSSVVLPGALPGARALVGDSLEAEDTTEPRLEQLRAELAAARQALVTAEVEVEAVTRSDPADDAAAIADAERRQADIRGDAAAARSALEEAERIAAERAAADAEAAQRLAEHHAQRIELERQRQEVEVARAELLARLDDAVDPGDPAPVEAALAALRRLRSVKSKPSTEATGLADRWAEVKTELTSMPEPPRPPEWLVTPALVALREARERLAAAESAAAPVVAEPAQVEALERAHREVIEAEQRAMKKGNRFNRRRLDAAHVAESTALAAIGVTSYGEYLRRVVNDGSGGGDVEVNEARAALADAEAVWEELHGGEASPEWTRANERLAGMRDEARAILGREVDDSELEDALRSHHQRVVQSEWAERELAAALRTGGVELGDDTDLELEAERWLAESPTWREARNSLAAELHDLESSLAAADQRLMAHQADVPAGSAEREEAGGDDEAPDTPDLPSLREGFERATVAEDQIEAELDAARLRLAASEENAGRIASLEDAAAARRAEVANVLEKVTEAEAAAAAAEAAGPAGGGGPSVRSVDLSGVVGMEAEAYLLARVAALRGAPAGPLPLIVDADVIGGLSDGAGRRVLRLVERLAGSMQVVVIGENEKVASWAEGLGDRAPIRAVAR